MGGKIDFRCCSEVVVEVLIWLWRDSVVTVCGNKVVVVKGLTNSRKHTCTGIYIHFLPKSSAGQGSLMAHLAGYNLGCSDKSAELWE